MPADQREAEVAVYREALRRHIELNSLRAAARDLGISPSGLHKLVFGGSRPYTGTLHRLREWYVRQVGDAEGPTPESARAAVDLLLRGVSPERRRRAEEGLMVLLKEAHKYPGRRQPEWIRELGRRLRSAAAAAAAAEPQHTGRPRRAWRPGAPDPE